MWRGIIVENGLEDRDPLERAEIVRNWEEGEWKLLAVEAKHADLPDIARCLAHGPWYMHFWEPDGDELIILFRNRTFRARKSDPSTHIDAISYGKVIGIPEEQLNFRTDWPE